MDGRIAFTGGINLSAVYRSGSFSRARRPATEAQVLRVGWRDTHLKLEGPAAAQLDALVRKAWADQSCAQTLLPSPAVAARPAAPAGDQAVRIVPAQPDHTTPRIDAMLMASLRAAQRRIAITMAYFAPGEEMVQALCEAARRGVDLRLVLPSCSDFAPVLHAGRARYQDLRDSIEITRAAWSSRSLWQRAKERTALWLERLWCARCMGTQASSYTQRRVCPMRVDAHGS